VQTFLSYKSFYKCAKHLDNKRLNKQITEALQIRDALDMLDSKGNMKPSALKAWKKKRKKEGKSTKRQPGWIHHPAVLMWIGYEEALEAYSYYMWIEWVKVRHKNHKASPKVPKANYKKPPWIVPTLLKTHRSNLLRKEYRFYRRYGWTVSKKMDYYWPYRWRNHRRTKITVKQYKNGEG
jgi:hypothetical protein